MFCKSRLQLLISAVSGLQRRERGPQGLGATGKLPFALLRCGPSAPGAGPGPGEALTPHLVREARVLLTHTQA